MYGLQPQAPRCGHSGTVCAALATLVARIVIFNVRTVSTGQHSLSGSHCIAAAATLACRQSPSSTFTQRLADDCALFGPLRRRLAKASDEKGWQGLRSAPVAPYLSGALVLRLLVSS